MVVKKNTVEKKRGKKSQTAAANNTVLGSKQGDGAFFEALRFLWSELVNCRFCRQR